MEGNAMDPSGTTCRPPLKVLLIAYACEPNRGSEPGTGWNTAIGLAKHHEVWVATRANNRGPVEAALAGMNEKERPRFLYLDPPAYTLRLKALGWMPIQVFYLFWQCVVAKHLRDCGVQFDIVHQLTFNSFEVPPFAFGGMSGRMVWGPIGGGQTAPADLLQAFGAHGARKEAWRNRRVKFSAKAPWVRRALQHSDLVLFANRETLELLGTQCPGETAMMIDVGVDARKFRPSEERNEDGSVTYLAAGRLEARKGMTILLEAFAGLATERPKVRLRIVGDGPERSRIKSRIAALGLDEQVTLTGAVSHETMRHEFERANVFVFPSLRDTSGAVVLEAMAMALPVVCLDHQGAAVMVTDECGLRIPVSSYGATVDALRDALARMTDDLELRRRCGTMARGVATQSYDWSAKVTRLDRLYRKLVSD